MRGERPGQPLHRGHGDEEVAELQGPEGEEDGPIVRPPRRGHPSSMATSPGSATPGPEVAPEQKEFPREV
ncbi:hypothetical protein GCM10010988_15800 [Cnuibacter physcomitrellae]|nr:hypothetical protein GCM10010988_15800 [Cnuibacter physcomitrellae]